MAEGNSEIANDIIITDNSNIRAVGPLSINNSFRGILRISPRPINNIFDDSIEGEADTSIFDVFTSDGVSLDLGISIDSIHYTNLYILGGLCSNSCNIKVYDESIENNSLFTLNGIPMPTHRPGNLTAKQGLIYKNNKFEYLTLEEILKATGNYEKFEKKKNFINIPTGSIHYFYGSKTDFLATKNLEYLPCDGSLYQVIDYPALAIFLDEKNIEYWEPDTDGILKKKIHKNNINDKKFRVPDLRTLFVEYGYETNIGKFQQESSGISEDNYKNHFHYIVLDSPSRYESNTEVSFNTIKFNNQNEIINGNLKDIRPLSKFGSMKPYTTSNNKIMPSNIYKTPDKTCGYILIADKSSTDTFAGASSANIDMSFDNFKDELNNILYTKDEKFIKYTNQNELTKLIGYENTPEFFTALPLIKI